MCLNELPKGNPFSQINQAVLPAAKEGAIKDGYNTANIYSSLGLTTFKECKTTESNTSPNVCSSFKSKGHSIKILGYYCSDDQWSIIEKVFLLLLFTLTDLKSKLSAWLDRFLSFLRTNQPYSLCMSKHFQKVKLLLTWEYFKQAAVMHLKHKSKQSLTQDLFPSVTEVFGTWSPTLSREGIWIDVTNVKQGQLSDVSQPLLVHFCTLHFQDIMMHSHHT